MRRRTPSEAHDPSEVGEDEQVIRVYVSGSRRDVRWFRKGSLISAVARYLEHKNAGLWYDQRRFLGERASRRRSEQAIDSAHIALVLISKHALESPFIQTVELPRIEYRVVHEGLVVIPLLLEECDWESLPLPSVVRKQHRKPKPLSNYVRPKERWHSVLNTICGVIGKHVDEVRHGFLPPRDADAGPAPVPTSAPAAEEPAGPVSRHPDTEAEGGTDTAEPAGKEVGLARSHGTPPPTDCLFPSFDQDLGEGDMRDFLPKQDAATGGQGTGRGFILPPRAGLPEASELEAPAPDMPVPAEIDRPPDAPRDAQRETGSAAATETPVVPDQLEFEVEAYAPLASPDAPQEQDVGPEPETPESASEPSPPCDEPLAEHPDLPEEWGSVPIEPEPLNAPSGSAVAEEESPPQPGLPDKPDIAPEPEAIDSAPEPSPPCDEPLAEHPDLPEERGSVPSEPEPRDAPCGSAVAEEESPPQPGLPDKPDIAPEPEALDAHARPTEAGAEVWGQEWEPETAPGPAPDVAQSQDSLEESELSDSEPATEPASSSPTTDGPEGLTADAGQVGAAPAETKTSAAPSPRREEPPARRTPGVLGNWMRRMRGALSPTDGAPGSPAPDEAGGEASYGEVPYIDPKTHEHCGRPEDQAPGTPPGETVDCTAFAPETVQQVEPFLVQVFLHTPEQANEAAARARRGSAAATRRAVKSLAAELVRSSRVVLSLAMPGVHVEDPVQAIVWDGAPESALFNVIVPLSYTAETLSGTVTVSLGGIPVGRLAFELEVIDTFSGREPSRDMVAVGDDAHRYSRAYLSHAPEDGEAVLSRAAQFKDLGIELAECTNGDDSDGRAFQGRIEGIDLFVLCWSEAASHSDTVRRETGYVLERIREGQAAPAIHPLAVGRPPLPELWDEVRHLRFTDAPDEPVGDEARS